MTPPADSPCSLGEAAELLPCPWGHPAAMKVQAKGFGPPSECYWVQCDGPFPDGDHHTVQTQPFATAAEAAEAWNRREQAAPTQDPDAHLALAVVGGEQARGRGGGEAATVESLLPGDVRFNGGVRCDMRIGPCACGATHPAPIQEGPAAEMPRCGCYPETIPGGCQATANHNYDCHTMSKFAVLERERDDYKAHFEACERDRLRLLATARAVEGPARCPGCVELEMENAQLRGQLDGSPPVDCTCAGCPRKVPSAWASSMCEPCATEDCEHADGAKARIAELEAEVAALTRGAVEGPADAGLVGLVEELPKMMEARALVGPDEDGFIDCRLCHNHVHVDDGRPLGHGYGCPIESLRDDIRALIARARVPAAQPVDRDAVLEEVRAAIATADFAWEDGDLLDIIGRVLDSLRVGGGR